MSRFALEISRWINPPTPYVDGACAPGLGVDCVRFVDAVLASLACVSLPALPVYPADASAHDGRAVARIALMMKSRFRAKVYRSVVDAGGLRAADVIVHRYRRSRRYPNHVMIVGDDGRVWHAIQPAGVCYTGRPPDSQIVRVYRPSSEVLNGVG